MEKLWGRFWFRLIASLICAPPLMLVGVYVALLAVQIVFVGDMVTAPLWETLPYLLVATAVMSLPLWIAMEVFNRRWRRPFPPGLAALFLLAFGGIFIGFLYLASRIEVINDLASGGSYSPFLVLGGCYAGTVAVTAIVAAPVVQRWKKRTATPVELSGVF